MTTTTETTLEALAEAGRAQLLAGAREYLASVRVGTRSLDDAAVAALAEALRLAAAPALAEALRDAHEALAAGLGAVAPATFAATLRLAGIRAARGWAQASGWVS